MGSNLCSHYRVRFFLAQRGQQANLSYIYKQRPGQVANLPDNLEGESVEKTIDVYHPIIS